MLHFIPRLSEMNVDPRLRQLEENNPEFKKEEVILDSLSNGAGGLSKVMYDSLSLLYKRICCSGNNNFPVNHGQFYRRARLSLFHQ